MLPSPKVHLLRSFSDDLPLPPIQSIILPMTSFTMIFFYYTYSPVDTNNNCDRCVAPVSPNCDLEHISSRDSPITLNSKLPEPPFFWFPWSVNRLPPMWSFIRLVRVLQTLFLMHYTSILHYAGFLSGRAAHQVDFMFCSRNSFTPDHFVLYKTQMCPTLEYFGHLRGGASSNFLSILSRIKQKAIQLIDSPLPTSTLQSLVHCWAVAVLSLFYCYYFGLCFSKPAWAMPFPVKLPAVLANGKLVKFVNFLSLSVTLLSFSLLFFSHAQTLKHPPSFCIPAYACLSLFRSRIIKLLCTSMFPSLPPLQCVFQTWGLPLYCISVYS